MLWHKQVIIMWLLCFCSNKFNSIQSILHSYEKRYICISSNYVKCVVLYIIQDERRPLFKELPLKSRMVLDQFAAQNHFTTLSQNIMWVLSIMMVSIGYSICSLLILYLCHRIHGYMSVNNGVNPKSWHYIRNRSTYNEEVSDYNYSYVLSIIAQTHILLHKCFH